MGQTVRQNNPAEMKRRLCLAPMLDRTDRHFRYFLRLISRQTVLFTEMVTVNAVLRGNREDLLEFHPSEHPLVLQLGGSEPKHLAKCSKIAEQAGYDEINLNIGCPSDRVQKGRFGACLMKEPELVAECIVAMQDQVNIPVSVKTRLGVDDQDSYNDVYNFIETVTTAGCSIFYMHARKAWLKGLSPKQNRNIPPLNYGMVTRLARDFPENEFIINGGIKELEQIQNHLIRVDGVMIGRQLYENPFILHNIDQQLFGDMNAINTRSQVLALYLDYVEQQLEQGVRLHTLVRHITGLYHGQPGARQWRRTLTENSRSGHNRLDTIKLALQSFKTDILCSQEI